MRKQLETAGQHVDVILIYEYRGMMSKPGSKIHAGTSETATLYRDYTEWTGRRAEIKGSSETCASNFSGRSR